MATKPLEGVIDEKGDTRIATTGYVMRMLRRALGQFHVQGDDVISVKPAGAKGGLQLSINLPGNMWAVSAGKMSAGIIRTRLMQFGGVERIYGSQSNGSFADVTSAPPVAADAFNPSGNGYAAIEMRFEPVYGDIIISQTRLVFVTALNNVPLVRTTSLNGNGQQGVYYFPLAYHTAGVGWAQLWSTPLTIQSELNSILYG